MQNADTLFHFACVWQTPAYAVTYRVITLTPSTDFNFAQGVQCRAFLLLKNVHLFFPCTWESFHRLWNVSFARPLYDVFCSSACEATQNELGSTESHISTPWWMFLTRLSRKIFLPLLLLFRWQLQAKRVPPAEGEDAGSVRQALH